MYNYQYENRLNKYKKNNKNNKIMSNWICSNCGKEFKTPTADFMCDVCPNFTGMLIENDGGGGKGKGKGNGTIEKNATGVGLYIFLVDSSGSMFDQEAFPGSPIKRAKLVSMQIAGALFNMEDTTKKEDAYIFVLLFDHRLKPFISFMSVKQLFDKYKTAKELEEAIYKEMETMQGATDINLALNTAYYHAQKFVDGEMEVIGSITPLTHSVFNPNTGQDKTIPNVRCLILTDGEQYTGSNGVNHIEPNPFSNFMYNGEYVNVLMGAYNGNGADSGCNELKSIMSNCHIHDIPQFFLFDNAGQVGDMYKLFRMASGASGFCPKCLEHFTIADRPKN